MAVAMLFIVLLYIGFIGCMDLRLSLGVKLEQNHNYYPVVVTLKEPLIYQVNHIDLFLVYDISGSMSGERADNLKNALKLVIDALDSKDRLSLIPFGTNAQTILDMKYMNSENKNYAYNLVDKQSIGGGTYFVYAIRELVKGIKSVRKDKDSG
jgi:uncharacterized protein with von Willebrand factor type A (vWA) domain